MDILMVSYRKDIEFAKASLASINKFATGFGGVTIMVPLEDVHEFRLIAAPYGYKVYGFYEPPGKGMLCHMVHECQADLHCPDADLILHLDSDCLFVAPVSPADYIHDNKPIMYRELFSNFQQHPHRVKWQKCVLDATGILPDYETMVRHPSVHWNYTYLRTRERIKQHTGMDFDQYILSCQNEYPQTFAEYPTLGAVAILDFPKDYCWIDYNDGGRDYGFQHDRDKLKSFWSHGGIEPYAFEIAAILNS